MRTPFCPRGESGEVLKLFIHISNLTRRTKKIPLMTPIYNPGHVSEKSVPWAFHEHFSFFAETYSLNGAESEKSCLQFFQSHLSLFYANYI